MKFISTTTVNGKALEFEAPLDTSIFREITLDKDDGVVILISLDVSKLAPAVPYIQNTDAAFIIEVSKQDIYVSAILYVNILRCQQELQAYEADGMIEFKVDLSEEEKKKILLAFINRRLTA